MLITGGVSPRTQTRVDVPAQQTRIRPCRAPPTDDLLTFEDDVLFEWSKSISPDFSESKKTRSNTEREKDETHLPGLFGDLTIDVLSQGPTSGSSMTSSSFGRRGSWGDISSRANSRCESVPLSVGQTRAFSPYRSETAPPAMPLDDSDIDISMSAMDMVSVASAHEIHSIERSKSGRLYGERTHRRDIGRLTKSARRARRPGEELYLQTKYKERPCSRAESFVNEELADTVTDLSRECCDVLGPRHCYDCSKITQRSDSALRNNSAFPSIHMSPSNFSTMALVQRLFPELSTMDVLEGMADGYISSRSFSRDILSELAQRKQDAEKRKTAGRHWKGIKRKISAFAVPDKQRFFANFTDLRAQIIAQRGSRTGMKGMLFPLTQAQQAPPPTEVEIVLKKEEERENPANYFGPPIMTREEIARQKSQPRFYAGADQEYKLPEPPPMAEILHKSNRAIRDMDAGSVVNPSKKKPHNLHNLKPPPERQSLGVLGGSDRAGGRPRGGMQHGRLGRPPGRPGIGGGAFGRKTLNSSSFSRPLQMATLDEDGSQSEREDNLEEEEEGEEREIEKNTKNYHRAGKGHMNFQASKTAITEEEEEEEEEEGETQNGNFLEETEDRIEEQEEDELVISEDGSDVISSDESNNDDVYLNQ